MGDRADEIATFDPMDTRAGAFATESASVHAAGFAALGDETGVESRSDFAHVEGDDDIEATRAQIEQTRTEMGHTIDAIQQRLSPQTLAEQAKDTVRDATIGKAEAMISNAGDAAVGAVANVGDSAKGFGDSLLTTVKQNPVPAALAGLGIGWLLVSGRKQSSQGNRRASENSPRYQTSGQYGYRVPEFYGTPGTGPHGDATGLQNAAGRVAGRAGDAAGQAINQVQDTAENVAGHVHDVAGNAAGQLHDFTGNVAGQVQDTASHVGYQAQVQTQRVAGSFQEILHNRPLAVAAGAIAVGVAVGLAIPETAQEDRFMGPTRESLVEQAQHTVQETAHKVQNVAGQAVDAAKAGAQKENLV